MSHSGEPRHRNDTYGNNIGAQAEEQPPIPAATVVLLRERSARLEVLMLHKASQIAFGGMWVFPGGRIDEEDYPADRDVNVAARNAALRETQEEAGIAVAPHRVVWFAHWTPPPGTPKRFATWFFAVRAGADEAVTIDGGEIQNHQWLAPDAALERHAAGEIDLAPPTWVTLHQLGRFATVDAALADLERREPRYYQTRVAKRADGIRVAMWHGDAGYDGWDADATGARHRLAMSPGGFVYENTVESD
ncbi:MAG TPA: NUDIX hydrolase [Pseudomonadales bacterium]|nr:NUDIX hydrolase [Pseudomonadales bacterium]